MARFRDPTDANGEAADGGGTPHTIFPGNPGPSRLPDEVETTPIGTTRDSSPHAPLSSPRAPPAPHTLTLERMPSSVPPFPFLHFAF